MMAGGYGRIGFARWPKWRLFGFRSDPVGTLEINLGRLVVPSNLIVNYRCKADGSIRAETLNGIFTQPGKKPVGQSLPLTGDSLSGQVRWQSGGPIPASPEADRIVRLRLDQAEIYAYEVRSAE
jgi:hypothetical protein